MERKKHAEENACAVYEGGAAWEAAEKNRKDSAEQSITIVCDGRSPREAAENLCRYIEVLGYETRLVTAEEYYKGEFDSVIIVGHHALSREWMDMVEEQYRDHGMR